MATGVTVHPLSINEQAQSGGTHAVILDYTALTEGDASQVIPLFTVAPKMAAQLVRVDLLEAFVSSDSSLISTTLSVGIGGAATGQLNAMEMNAAGTEVFLANGIMTNATRTLFTGNDTIDATVACTTDKLLTTHTAGRVRLIFRIEDNRSQK